jgi:hypothetical protein
LASSKIRGQMSPLGVCSHDMDEEGLM